MRKHRKLMRGHEAGLQFLVAWKPAENVTLPMDCLYLTFMVRRVVLM